MSVYGYCPVCNEPGVLRERRPNGWDVCAKAHKYPSASALKEQRPPKPDLSQQISELANVIMELDLRGQEDGGACQVAAIRIRQLKRLLEDLAPIVRYVRVRQALPLYGADDLIHGVHPGTVWEASLKLSDLEKIVANPIVGK